LFLFSVFSLPYNAFNDNHLNHDLQDSFPLNKKHKNISATILNHKAPGFNGIISFVETGYSNLLVYVRVNRLPYHHSVCRSFMRL